MWVTGAGSGLGLESSLLLASRGFRVFGSVLTDAEDGVLRKAAAERGVTCEILRTNVTREVEIQQSLDKLLSAAGRIDAVVQFAGMGLRGFIEDLTLEEVREVFDVNFFGIMAVSKAVLPVMRAARHGRIILTSSTAGRMASMSIGGYASSKFAVEGFGECLHQEMRPFGVWVSLLEPGLIHTPHFTVNRNQAKRAKDPSSPYYPWFRKHEQLVDDIMARNSFGPVDVAKAVHRILTARRPRLRYIVGSKAKWIINMRRYFPGESFERVYWSMVRRMVTKEQ